VDVAEEPRRGSNPLRAGSASECQKRRALRERHRLRIGNDRHIHAGDEQLAFRSEVGVDGLHGHAGRTRDVTHPGGGPTLLAEEFGGRLDHGGPRLAGLLFPKR
jgi:hypothetical protein